MDQHLHNHITTSPFGSAGEHIQRIQELENEVKGIKNNLVFYKDQYDKRAKVKDRQGLNDFLDYINQHLLHDDLTISLQDVDDDGVSLLIEDAMLDHSGNGDQPRITPKQQEYIICGTFTVEWNARVRATSEEAASDLIDDLMPSEFDRISVSIHDDAVLEFEVQDYISDHDISDISEA